MALNPPPPGLRRFVNKSNHVAKVDLRIPAGSEVEVDEYVAGQLGAEFTEVAAVEPAPKPAAKATKKKP